MRDWSSAMALATDADDVVVVAAAEDDDDAPDALAVDAREEKNDFISMQKTKRNNEYSIMKANICEQRCRYLRMYLSMRVCAYV